MSYWEDRQKELYKQLEEDEEKLKKRLSSYYCKESQKLENNIGAYYAKYGENNVIEYRKMMETLSNEDISLLMEQMDEFANKYPRYAYLMPVRESIYKLNRLEGLQTTIKMQQLEIGAIDNEILTEHLTKQAHRGVNAAAETMGFGKNFYAINSEVVKSFVNVAYANGKNFSESIWSNTDKLANYLNTDVAQAMARGDSYERIIKNMKERFETVSRNDMYRLVYTEGTHVMAESTIKPFEDDYEEYKISTAGDSKVCSICRGISEKVFKIKDRVAGVNFPPFHAWCRCTFEVYVEDWDKWMDDYVEKHGGNASKQSQSIANKLNNKSQNGIINIQIDELTHCLKRLSDGVILNTELSKYKPNKKELKGWKFNWSNVDDEFDIYKLTVSEDERIQGLIAMKNIEENSAYYVNLVESAPFNVTGKEYSGVGGHLFAEAVKNSFNSGYDGFIYFNAKTNLIDYYEKELGAKLIDRNTGLMIIEGKEAKQLYERYYGKK